MIENINTRIAIVLAVLFISVATVVPNFVKLNKDTWWISKAKLVYGLDIQGGLHLVMGVDVEGVIKEEANRFASSLKEHLTSQGLEIDNVETVNALIGELRITTHTEAGVVSAQKYVQENYSQQLQVVEALGQHITVRYFENYLNDRKQKVLGQAIETLRNRIDEFGVSEPSITAQGDNRILIQLPGIEDASRAKELINKTAKLEFMLLHEKMDGDKLNTWIQEAESKGGYSLSTLKYSEYVKRLNTDLKETLPEKSTVFFERAANAKTLEKGAIPYLLRTDTDVGGSELKDAFVSNDEYGAWEVAFNLNPAGTKKFADLTGANVGRQMAVVLDNVVYTAPQIIAKIPNGSGRITMGSGNSQEVFDEASLVATALRAGALPASLEQLEERTVGPSLGADSIAKGKKASLVAGILVIVFMILYYKAFGVVANIALCLNILLIFSMLTALGATLTLPGIAGVALTIGMAVDANVIIYERIKEELAKGAGLHIAIKEGYHRAFSAIFDGNLTTAFACFILMYYGTGPVRGFAVTLLIGLTASMFTAIFVTRTIFEFLIIRMGVRKISI